LVSWKGAVALTVLLAGLIGVFLWMGRQQTPAAPPLFPCDITDALDLKVTAADGRMVEIARSGLSGTWAVAQPSPGPAEPEFAQGMVQSLHSIKPDDTLRGADPAQFGLDKPTRTVTCRVSSGRSYTLTVGKERFDGGGYYAQKAGDPNVYVISSVPVDDFDNRLKQPPYLGNYLPTASPTT
jgi:hypothetical protein